MQKLRVALLAASTVGAAVLFYSSSPAQADVTATSGSAFGAQARLLGIDLIPPTPAGIVGGPAIGYPVVTGSTASIGLPSAFCPLFPAGQPTNVPLLNILDVCGITVSTFGLANANPHLNSANSTATVAGVALGGGPNGTLTLNAINVSCKADGDDATAAVSVANATLGNGQLLSGPISPNTAVSVPGTLAVILNAQVKTKALGTNGIVAEAVRITLLDNTVIALGHVECLATGPDVNQVTTSSTAPTTSSTAPATTSSTVPGTTSSTVPGTTSSTGQDFDCVRVGASVEGGAHRPGRAGVGQAAQMAGQVLDRPRHHLVHRPGHHLHHPGAHDAPAQPDDDHLRLQRGQRR